LSSSLIIIQNLVTIYHTVYAHKGGPKNLGSSGPRHLGWGVAYPLPPINTSLFEFVNTRNSDAFRSYRMGVDMGPRNFGDTVAPPPA